MSWLGGRAVALDPWPPAPWIVPLGPMRPFLPWIRCRLRILVLLALWALSSSSVFFLLRFPLTFVLGVSLGLQLIAAVEGDMVPQLAGTFAPFSKGALFNTYSFWTSIGLIVLLVGVLSTLTYFFFSREHKGVLGATSRVGVYFLMVAFGASFGYTVMARISLLFGRVHFLLSDWMHLLR